MLYPVVAAVQERLLGAKAIRHGYRLLVDSDEPTVHLVRRGTLCAAFADIVGVVEKLRLACRVDMARN